MTGMFLSLILFMSIASAVTINIDPISFDTLGEKQLMFSSFENNDSISLGVTPNLNSYISLQFDYISESEQYTKIFLNTMPTEDINGYLFYGTQSTPISISSPEPEAESASNFISFPSAKNFEYKQGDIYNEALQLRLSSSYPNPIKITYVDFSPATSVIRQGNGLETGVFINPGDSFSIPVIIDTTDAQAGSYSPVVVSVEYDDDTGLHTMESTVTLYVTAGVSPITGDTFSTSPTCSLSSTTFNLNSTYSFTCGGVVSNLEVNIPSSDFYIGKSVEISSGIYKYDFMPIKYGETEFKAEFRYNGASIFAPFQQDIRISSSGSIISGTNLKLIFTPKLEGSTGDEELFFIQLGDNETGSLVSEPRVYVNAIELTSTSETFEYSFIPNRDYEIRGKSIGYDDLVETVNMVPKNIAITVSPKTGDTSTNFNITTSVDNATITIQEIDYSGSYYGSLSGGNVEIKVSKSGYKTETINFTVDDRPRIISFGAEFEKGEPQNFTLNKEGSWVVYHKEKIDSTNKNKYSIGVGDLIEFTPKKNGFYIIEFEGITIGTYEIVGFNFTNEWGFLPAWAWLLLGVILILVVLVVIARSRNNMGNSSSSDKTGMSFNVGDQN